MKINEKIKDELKYPSDMDVQCIELYYLLNSLPNTETIESCCGHEREVYMMFFKCNNVGVLSRLGRAVSKNYSDGNWEIVVDTSDTMPYGCFWLRTKTVLKENELNESLNNLIESIKYWFDDSFDKYFEPKPNGEDYGIDALFNAKRILEMTLGKVSGYQSDDGILEHKCAISAVTKLYENNGIVPQKENHFRFSYTKTTYFNYCSTCPHSRFHDDDSDCTHNRCELLNKYIHCYLDDGDKDFKNKDGILDDCPFLKNPNIVKIMKLGTPYDDVEKA